MTTSYIYIFTFKEKDSFPNKYWTYIGITKDMDRRMKEHKNSICITTNRYFKTYKFVDVRYSKIKEDRIPKIIERRFKNLSLKNKLDYTCNWTRWTW